MVYVGPGEEGGTALWIRDFDQNQPWRVPGTEGAWQPFFSPDGEQVGFIGSLPEVSRFLKVVRLKGGSPVQLAESGFLRGGGSWGTDGFIYFVHESGVIQKIPETGGAARVVTTLEPGESRHNWPEVLPGGRGLIFTVMRGTGAYDYRDAGIAALDPATGDHEMLTRGALARYAASGHLLVVQEDGALFVCTFDTKGFSMGDPVPLSEKVVFNPSGAYGAADLSISANGTIVYVAGREGGGLGQLVWVERSGQVEPIDPDAGVENYQSLALSPDDQRLALSIVDGFQELWVKELPDGPMTRLTPKGVRSARPVWSVDGQTVAYIQYEGTDTLAAQVRSDGSDLGTFTVLLDRDRPVWEVEFTPDEKRLVFREGTSDSGEADLGYLDREADSVHGDILPPGFEERAVALSPDGRWMAYVSDAQGRDEVYVRPFPSVGDGLIQVSINGGREPLWAHNGRELFFRDESSGWLTAASYVAESTFEVRDRQPLFNASGFRTQSGGHAYDITKDDRRFIFTRIAPPDGGDDSLFMVQNFFTELYEQAGR